MKTQSLLLVLLLVAFSFTSCKKDDTPKPSETNNPTGGGTGGTGGGGTGGETPAPQIQDISPNNGPKTTIVTITGSNFGTDINKAKVYFNTVEGEIQSITNTEIVSVVPSKAFTGIVSVSINAKQAEGPIFTYTITDINVNTFAGSKESGNNDGNVDIAKFNSPYNMALDSEGNIYVADRDNHRIRKIDTNGEVTTYAGSDEGFQNGDRTSAKFSYPSGIAIDSQNNIYIADFGNHRIRKITPQGIVSTPAGLAEGDTDGQGAIARFSYPTGINLDKQGNLYIADQGNDKIKKMDPNGLVATVAGSTKGFEDNDNALNAKFNTPTNLVLNADGAIYVCDYENHKIRVIGNDGKVTTLAGNTSGDQDGSVESALFSNPAGIAIDGQGNLYISDYSNHKIKMITPSGGVTTLAGNLKGDQDGAGNNAKFNLPLGLAIDNDRTLLIADRGNNKIKKLVQE